MKIEHNVIKYSQIREKKLIFTPFSSSSFNTYAQDGRDAYSIHKIALSFSIQHGKCSFTYEVEFF